MAVVKLCIISLKYILESERDLLASVFAHNEFVLVTEEAQCTETNTVHR